MLGGPGSPLKRPQPHARAVFLNNRKHSSTVLALVLTAKLTFNDQSLGALIRSQQTWCTKSANHTLGTRRTVNADQCCGRAPRDALQGGGPQRRPQKRLDRRLEEVAEAVGGGYCR